MADHGDGVRLPKVLQYTKQASKRGGDALEQLGQQGAFYAGAAGGSPRVIRRYKKEVIRLLSEVAFGTGALAVIGGTVVIVVFMTFFTGLEVGQQGYNSLNSLGAAVYTGFVSAYFNTREIAPIIAGIALSATVGCGFTAQLGAMRVSEEIDALETLAVPSVPYLVTTRLIAGFVAVIPLYVLGLLASYVSTELITTKLFGQSSGTYHHYFIAVPAAQRHLHLVRQGARLRGDHHPDALLLRLHRDRRTGGRGRGGGPRGPARDHQRRRHRPAARPRALRHQRLRPDRGLMRHA